MLDFIDPSTGKWHCVQCGACCFMAAPAEQAGYLPRGFSLSSGRCRYLTADRKCAIYDVRPDICRRTPEGTDEAKGKGSVRS